MKLYKNTLVYIISVILIFSFVFITTFSFDRMIENDIRKMWRQVEAIREDLNGQNEQLPQSCERLRAIWHKHMDHWSFCLDHGMIKEVDLTVSLFLQCAEDGLKESAELEAVKLKRLFEVVRTNDKLVPLNIF